MQLSRSQRNPVAYSVSQTISKRTHPLELISFPEINVCVQVSIRRLAHEIETPLCERLRICFMVYLRHDRPNWYRW